MLPEELLKLRVDVSTSNLTVLEVLNLPVICSGAPYPRLERFGKRFVGAASQGFGIFTPGFSRGRGTQG